MAGSRCRPASAPPCSPTISATSAMLSLPRTAWSTSTPGAAAITPTNATAPDGGFLVALQDTNGRRPRRQDRALRPGPRAAIRRHGHRALQRRALRRDANDRIVRYACRRAAIAPTGGARDRRVGPAADRRPPHASVQDRRAGRAVSSTSARPPTPASGKNRRPSLPGIQPCTELETRAGIWRYDANSTGQLFSPAERFATGLRNGEGIAFDSAGRIFADAARPRPAVARTGARSTRPSRAPIEPAEELVAARAGADYGWPKCYLRPASRSSCWRRNTAATAARPSGDCAQQARRRSRPFPRTGRPTTSQSTPAAISRAPTAAAPSSPSTARGTARRCRRAATTSSSSRSPTARRRGDYVVFADGFAGAVERAGPCRAPAVGPRGRARRRALRLRRPARTHLAHRLPRRHGGDGDRAGPGARRWQRRSTAAAGPPEGVHPDAGSQIASLPVPAGATPADVALGNRISWQRAPAPAAMAPTPRARRWGPTSPRAKWLWGDGSVQSIAKIITEGVPNPKEFRSPMPPMGGPSSRRRRCRRSRTTSGRSAMRAAPPRVRRADEGARTEALVAVDGRVN